jgi:glycosyltransferase involved in cell wall biosynthesis
MTNRKITLLTNGIYPYVMGGMQKHSYYLTKYLAKNRVEVELYHFVANDKPLVEELKGFTKEELKYITHHCFNFPKLDSLPGHYIRENKKLSQLYFEEYLSKQTFSENHVIYAKGFSGWRFIEAKKNKIELPPILVNFHGLEMFQKAPSFRVKLEHLMLRKSVMFNIKYSDYSISYGGKISDILRGLLGDKSETKLIEIPSGIEPLWLNQSELHVEKPIKFVFVGRFERRKGIEELNRVLEEISESENFEFNFIGPIPEKKRVDNTLIKYHGSISDQENIKVILQNCDVMVTPSWSEGMPTVIWEGMASGCAIIATDVGAVAEQVDASNGWLIEAGNKKQLKETIVEAINLPKERLLQKKQNSIKKIKDNFLWEDVIKKTITELSSKVEEPHNPACAKDLNKGK